MLCLEIMQCMNDLTEPVLKLSRFSLAYGEGKSAAISKIADFWVPSNRSYIVLALAFLIAFRMF